MSYVMHNLTSYSTIKALSDILQSHKSRNVHCKLQHNIYYRYRHKRLAFAYKHYNTVPQVKIIQ